MSTAHTGEYCPHKDKMMLSREEARDTARRLGADAYQCDECGSWHTAHKRTGSVRGKQRAKSHNRSKR